MHNTERDLRRPSDVEPPRSQAADERQNHRPRGLRRPALLTVDTLAVRGLDLEKHRERVEDTLCRYIEILY